MQNLTLLLQVRVYDSHSAMAGDSSLHMDAAYVGTPASAHADLVCELLGKGRATLCEKPLATNINDIRRCYEAARANDTLLMEGVWTRCFPATVKARELLRSGGIGQVIGVQADFGYDIQSGAPAGIRGDPDTGGITRDIGIYLVEKALLAYDPSLYGLESAAASAVLGITDSVDLSVSACLRFADSRKISGDERMNGGVASLMWTGLANTPETAMFFGTKGSLYFDQKHHTPESFVLRTCLSRTETFEERHHFPPPVDDGLHAWNYPGSISLQYEAQAFEWALRKGLKEVPEWTHSDSIAAHSILKTMLHAQRAHSDLVTDIPPVFLDTL